jgi:hypothetical protein
MTMMNRVAPNAPPTLVLTDNECKVLDRAVPDRVGAKGHDPTLAKYLTKIAKLGGYIARSHDPPPGNIVMWRGWRRLMDISAGYNLALKDVGN